MEPPWDVRMKICSNVPGHMAKIAFSPIYGKNLQKYLSSEPRDWWPWNLVYSIAYSSTNDDTGLTLTIFMTWPNLLPNASGWINAYTAYSHVFPSLFSISYALRWATQGQWSSGFHFFSSAKKSIFEPRHKKTCICHMRTTKAQISMRIRAVWSAPLLFAA